MKNIKEFILESSKALSTVEFNKVIQALLTGEYVEWYRKMISPNGDEKEATEWLNTTYDDDRTGAELCMFIEDLVGHHNFDMWETIDRIFKNKEIKKKFNL